MRGQLAERIQGISPFYVMELLHRARQLEAQGKDVIHMEIGEPDFATPKSIVDAGVKQLLTGEVKYTPAAGLPELRQKIAAFYKQRYCVNVAKERIFVTPGASGAFLLALGISLNPGEELLMADPCYPCNSNFVKLFEGKTKTIPVDASSRYQLTADCIKQHWTPATKGALIASPSNPTGTLIAPEALQQAILTVNDLGGCFYSDEIYHGLVYEGREHSILEFTDRAFVLNGFSKLYAMTGWRLGYLIAPREFIRPLQKIHQNFFISANSVAQWAGITALNQAQEDVARMRDLYDQRRKVIIKRLKELGFGLAVEPTGAFYVLANAKAFHSDSYKLAFDILKKAKVGATPGIDFGDGAEGYLRFTYANSIERIEEGMERLQAYLSREEYKEIP